MSVADLLPPTSTTRSRSRTMRASSSSFIALACTISPVKCSCPGHAGMRGELNCVETTKSKGSVRSSPVASSRTVTWLTRLALS